MDWKWDVMDQPIDLKVTSLEISRPQTPIQLADQLGVSLVTVLKALVGRSRYFLPSQPMEVQAALEVARDLGFIVKDNVIGSPPHAGLQLKSNWRAFHLSVRQRQLRELYHFTAPENLSGILTAGGLLSRRRLAEHRIHAKQNSWGSPEKERLLGADYICLSVTKGWAMMGSLMAQGAEPPVVLVIDPCVVWYCKTCFSPINSASREIDPVQLRTWTEIRHFEALFPDSRATWPKDVQAEVLVYERVVLDDIKYIVFHSQAGLESARERCGLDRSHPLIGKVRVNPNCYPFLER